MEWEGKQLATIGDLSDAVLAIARADDQDAADRFMAQYRAENEHADANVGYLSGYYGTETMQKVQRMFRAEHPIFGNKPRSDEELFDAGAAMAMGVDPKSVFDDNE